MAVKAVLKSFALTTVAAFFAVGGAAISAVASPIGVWLAKGESGGGGHVQIYKCSAKLCGKLIWSANANARDAKNPDPSKRNRKVVGITVLWGFQPDGKNQWDSGRIYDPSSGKTYKCIMRQRAGGRQLHVRGYVGISLIGKTQVWTRVRRVITSLTGRSDRTRKLAADAGIEDAGPVADVVAVAEVVLSILPPDKALPLARACANASARAGKLYVDCNAVSPATVAEISATVEAAGFDFLDGGIVGPALRGTTATRLYISGPAEERLAFLEDERLTIRDLGPEIGKASALKMCYAAQTKGSWTLFAALSTAAHRLGVGNALDREFAESQAAVRDAPRRMLPRLPLDAGRWVGEMEEIAATLAAAGLPSGFHEAAAEMFRLLDETPFASETRQNWNEDRTAEQTVAAVSDIIDQRKANP